MGCYFVYLLLINGWILTNIFYLDCWRYIIVLLLVVVVIIIIINMENVRNM